MPYKNTNIVWTSVLHQHELCCIFILFVLKNTQEDMYVKGKSINFRCRLWIELNHHNFIQVCVLFRQNLYC